MIKKQLFPPAWVTVRPVNVVAIKPEYAKILIDAGVFIKRGWYEQSVSNGFNGVDFILDYYSDLIVFVKPPRSTAFRYLTIHDNKSIQKMTELIEEAREINKALINFYSLDLNV